ncbi:hypothetical protein V8E53_005888, partial [Lactarius tabidus]
MMRYAFSRYIILGLSPTCQATDQFIPLRLKYCKLRIANSLTLPPHAHPCPHPYYAYFLRPHLVKFKFCCQERILFHESNSFSVCRV